jgi:hypothetical protein
MGNRIATGSVPVGRADRSQPWERCLAEEDSNVRATRSSSLSGNDAVPKNRASRPRSMQNYRMDRRSLLATRGWRPNAPPITSWYRSTDRARWNESVRA